MTEYVRLGDVATINPPKKQVANLADDDIVGFLPMDAVSNNGEIERIDIRKYSDVKTGFVYFGDGDILFAKITPCMENGKGAIVSGMPSSVGFGSTEFHVVRPNEEIIYGRYIHYFLKNPALRKILESKMTGSAGQKRVSKDTLKELVLPLPTLEEQKRIAVALDTMSSVIAKRKRQIALLDEAAKSLFVEMFGDPVENPMGWVVKQINSFSTVKIGPFGSALHQHDYIVGGHPLINPKHISNGTIYPDLEITVDDEKYHILDAYALSRGDVIVGRRGDIGRCAVVNEDGYICGTGSLFIRILDSCNSIYLKSVIEHPKMRKRLEDSSVGVTMKNLNAKIVSSFNIPLPPLDLQNLFAARIEALEAQRASCERGLRQMETAFAAMMQEYFG